MTFLTAARQSAMQPWSRGINPQPAPSHLRRQGFFETFGLGLAHSVVMLLVVSAILGGRKLPAQTPASRATKPAQQQAATNSAQPNQSAPEATVAPPPASSAADQPPNQAKVSWGSRGLEIEAFNSSLNQILHQVAADTGAKLEGLTTDQRVFGRYGPGPVSEVLLKLLEGSGYNVLMIGGRDADAPVEIVLSARLPASPQTTANNQNRGNVQQLEPKPQPDSSAEPPRPQPIQNPFGNGEPPRDPLQFMQEILQRQEKIDQPQQQDQQNNPHH
jgi:hypothetical protein